MWPIFLNECLNLIISDLQKYSTQRKLPSSIPKRHRESATPSGVTDSPYVFPCGLCPPPGHNLVQAVPYPLRALTAFLPCTWADSDVGLSLKKAVISVYIHWCTLIYLIFPQEKSWLPRVYAGALQHTRCFPLLPVYVDDPAIRYLGLASLA